MKKVSYILIAQFFILFYLTVYFDVGIGILWIRISAIFGIAGFILNIIAEEREK